MNNIKIKGKKSLGMNSSYGLTPNILKGTEYAALWDLCRILLTFN